MDKNVFVVCGWNEDYMDVIGVFIDEQEAYDKEAEKSGEYLETRIIESTLTEPT